MALMQRAIFLDKDGTLVENVPFNVDPDQIRLLPGVLPGLKMLSGAGYRLFVVTNQSGIARGYFSPSALAVVEGRLKRLLGQAGIPLDGFYYCPHHPQGSVARYVGACECRKPEPGLLIRATTENGLDRANSWAIGDILNDVEAGHRAGCKSVLIDNGNETEWVLAPLREPEYTARDLVEAACMILADEKQGDRFLNHLNGGGHPQ